MVQPDRPRLQCNTAHALCMPDNVGKNTDTHSGYVIHIAHNLLIPSDLVK
jgi:hypothetical protein